MYQISKPTIFFLFSLTVLSLASAVDNRLRVKAETIVSCGTYGANRTGNAYLKPELHNQEPANSTAHANNNQPEGKDRGNGCSHQQGVSALCDLNGGKRRFQKIATCT